MEQGGATPPGGGGRRPPPPAKTPTTMQKLAAIQEQMPASATGGLRPVSPTPTPPSAAAAVAATAAVPQEARGGIGAIIPPQPKPKTIEEMMAMLEAQTLRQQQAQAQAQTATPQQAAAPVAVATPPSPPAPAPAVILPAVAPKAQKSTPVGGARQRDTAYTLQGSELQPQLTPAEPQPSGRKPTKVQLMVQGYSSGGDMPEILVHQPSASTPQPAPLETDCGSFLNLMAMRVTSMVSKSKDQNFIYEEVKYLLDGSLINHLVKTIQYLYLDNTDIRNILLETSLLGMSLSTLDSLPSSRYLPKPNLDDESTHVFGIPGSTNPALKIKPNIEVSSRGAYGRIGSELGNFLSILELLQSKNSELQQTNAALSSSMRPASPVASTSSASAASAPAIMDSPPFITLRKFLEEILSINVKENESIQSALQKMTTRSAFKDAIKAAEQISEQTGEVTHLAALRNATFMCQSIEVLAEYPKDYDVPSPTARPDIYSKLAKERLELVQVLIKILQYKREEQP